MKVEMIKCDGCGHMISDVSKRYHIDRIILRTLDYTDAAGDTDYNQIVSDLCPACARQVGRVIISKGGDKNGNT